MDGLLFGWAQRADGLGEGRVEAIDPVLWVTVVAGQSVGDDPFGEPFAPAATPTVVGEASPRDSVAPGERVVGRHVVEPAPHGEQRVGEHVSGVVRGRAATQVALQRFVDVGGDGFEAPGERRVGPHVHLLSGTPTILSPFRE